MKFIGKDEVLFELLKDVKIRILDAMVRRINIFIQDVEELYIEIDFDQVQFYGYRFRLKFSAIKEYSFSYDNTHTFLTVENFTLFKHDNLFYLCISPEDERLTYVSENDQDFVLFSSFEGYIIDSSETSSILQMF